MTIKVPYEDVQPGPVGRKIEIVDYDISNDRYYKPIDLDDPFVLMGNGLEPSEADPRFHQQMVYAVASETVRRFEFALGREIRWNVGKGKARNSERKLRIYPHAFQQANAFYDPERRSVFFGYFAASQSDPGSNLPNQTIFTCLSHDIVAHEVTHALVDSVRPHYTEATYRDMPAFHEAFADIVALFQHFSMRDALIDTIRRTGGLFYRPKLEADAPSDGDSPQIVGELSRDNPLVGLAQQFGEGMGMRKALRSAIGTRPNSKDIDTTFEPHLRGAILVAAVFDAYFSIYVKRSRDLLRLAGAGGSKPTDLHPDLAIRLCNEATKTADHILNICLRALDYCPPVDITFGEFLRAMITADSDLVPDDPWGYRSQIIEAFRLRGIVPEDVASYSEEALRWCGPIESNRPLPPCEGLHFDVLHEVNPNTEALNKARAHENAVTLQRYAASAPRVTAALGLVSRLNKQDLKIQVSSFHPIHRVGPNGQLEVDFVVQYLQQRQVAIDPANPKSGTMLFRGGSTVIFNHRGEVRYVIVKSVGSKTRLARQRAYLDEQAEMSAVALYAPDADKSLSFSAIHRGF
ncbi:MAG TPA: hypothetical protein VGF56_00720 [Rhizomicrobium sp.]